MEVVAAWRIKCEWEEKLSQFYFLRSISIALIETEEANTFHTENLPKQTNDWRINTISHFIECGYKQSMSK